MNVGSTGGAWPTNFGAETFHLTYPLPPYPVPHPSLLFPSPYWGLPRRPRRRRRDPFPTDWEIFRLARRRVKFFSTATAQQKFDGEFDLSLLTYGMFSSHTKHVIPREFATFT
jgi:hypothetical protein